MAWVLQSAPTRGEWELQLEKIRECCQPAARYFDEQVIHKHAYQYKFNENKVATHGFKTSQIVECGNGVFVPARREAPYRFHNHVLRWIGSQFDERLEKMRKWIQKGHMLTPYAHKQWSIQTEIAKRSGTQVTSMGAQVYNLQNVRTNKEYAVDLDNPDCCFYVHTHKLPCRHMLVVFHKKGFLRTQRTVTQCLEKYWPKWAWAKEYVRIYMNRCIRAPPCYAGPSKGPPTDAIDPPLQTHKKRGRPKKNRYIYRPKTVQNVRDQLPRVYNADFGLALKWM